MLDLDQIAKAIDESPLNRGISGADWLAVPGNLPIASGADISLFEAEGDGVYEMHVLYASRGRPAIDAAKAAIDQLFSDREAELVFAMVPDFRRDVKMLARWAGMKFGGKRNTAHGLCDLFVLPREIWKGDE